MLKGKTILLVDDDDRNIMALSAALRIYKPTILSAHDGTDCLEKLDQNKNIDLILLDMMMPEMDGYETLKNIRLNNTVTRIPVISLTAQAMKGDKQKCIEAGADDYCPKPVDVVMLLGQIKKQLQL